jgi:hypothetical protein
MEKFIKKNNLKLFKIVKDIGSAYLKSQEQLKSLLKSCKNKTIVVYDPSRLSRNVVNFKDIYSICQKQNHNIAIVSINTIFNIFNKSNYKILFDLISKAQEESRLIGERISRTYRYKKDKQLPWGNNLRERNITTIIKALSLHHSSIPILSIGNIILSLSPIKEPFEIIEYDDYGYERPITGVLPYAMSTQKIADTLNHYQIFKRNNAKWTSLNVFNIINDFPIYGTSVDDSLNSITSDINSSFNPYRQDNVVVDKVDESPSSTNWISFWYDPEFGTPPGIKIPTGMSLPTFASSVMIPKSV